MLSGGNLVCWSPHSTAPLLRPIPVGPPVHAHGPGSATQGAIRAMIQPAIAPAHTASVGKALPLSSAEP